MKRQKGSSLIVVLLFIGVLILTAGGVVIWEKKVSPVQTPTPTPSPQVLPIPTVSPTWTQSCASDNDCPKQFCQPPGKPCAQYYCIQGKCQLVEPNNRYPTPTSTPSPTSVLEKGCAVNGESPTNFDLTTGKFRPDGKVCCKGLKAIGPKTPLESLNKGLCMEVAGSPGICKPCGNGICDAEYEDRCNCPEDCK